MVIYSLSTFSNKPFFKKPDASIMNTLVYLFATLISLYYNSAHISNIGFPWMNLITKNNARHYVRCWEGIRWEKYCPCSQGAHSSYPPLHNLTWQIVYLGDVLLTRYNIFCMKDIMHHYHHRQINNDTMVEFYSLKKLPHLLQSKNE